MTDSTQDQEKKKSLKRVFLWAGALIIFDAFVLNQGVISALIGAWMLLVAFPRAVFLTKASELKVYRLKRVVIFIGAVALVIIYTKCNNLIAEKRAETLVVAVNAFKEKNQRYPAKLEELAPDFIDHVPVAKYSVMDNSFHYTSTPEGHSLYYVVIPPYGRRVYSFENNKWHNLD